MKIIIDLTPEGSTEFAIRHVENEQPYTPEIFGDEVVVTFDGAEMTAHAFRQWVRRLADVERSTDPQQAYALEHLRKMNDSIQSAWLASVLENARLKERIAELEAENEGADTAQALGLDGGSSDA